VLLEEVDGATLHVPADAHPVRRILVGFDGSSGAWAALERAIAIAVSDRALLTIAAVVPEPVLYAGLSPMVLPVSPEVLRRDAERATLRLLAAARDEVPATVSVTTQAFHGRPAKVLAALAEAGGYDLIVTGPRRTSRLRRLLGASVTRALLARSRSSVLAIR
jgi:nucleotide-binding universal stress UspA family protein